MANNHLFSMDSFTQNIITKKKFFEKNGYSAICSYVSISNERSKEHNSEFFVMTEHLEKTIARHFSERNTEAIKKIYNKYNLSFKDEILEISSYEKISPLEQALMYNNGELFTYILRKEKIEIPSPYMDYLFRSFSSFDTKEIKESLTILKELLAQKVDINQQTSKPPILNRYINKCWERIENDDPVIAVCLASGSNLCNAEKHIISKLLKSAYICFMKYDKASFATDRKKHVRYLFCPFNDTIPQFIFVLKQLCFGVINNSSCKINAIEKLAKIMKTKTLTIGSPRQCLARFIQKEFTDNKELHEIIFNTSEYFKEAVIL